MPALSNEIYYSPGTRGTEKPVRFTEYQAVRSSGVIMYGY